MSTDGVLHVIRPDGRGLQTLSFRRRPLVGRSPAWSPDRRWIAFTHVVPRPHPWTAGRPQPWYSEIYVVSRSCTSLRRLTHNNLYDDDPSWSPDGKRIAFTRFSACHARKYSPAAPGSPGNCGHGDLWIMNRDGSRQRRLTRTRASDVNPGWSPNGRWIAFDSVDARGRAGVSLVRVDGRSRRVLSPSLETGDPAWSPDGRRLAFTAARGLTTVRPDGRDRRLYRLEPPAYPYALEPSWSPDGGSLVAAELINDAELQRLFVLDVRTRIRRPLTSGVGAFSDIDPAWSR